MVHGGKYRGVLSWSVERRTLWLLTWSIGQSIEGSSVGPEWEGEAEHGLAWRHIPHVVHRHRATQVLTIGRGRTLIEGQRGEGRGGLGEAKTGKIN